MNRPFGAFITLIVFLTLAVAALSTSSRSTTVGPASCHVNALLPTKGAGGANYVFVFPAPLMSEELEAISANELQVPTDDEESSQTGLDTPQSLQTLVSAMIREVDDVKSAEAVLPNSDCLSHYDPAYDLAVYGYTADVKCTPLSLPASLPAEEIVVLFDELGVHREKHSLAPAALFTVWLRLSSATVAARLWFVYQWRRLIDELPRLTANSSAEEELLEWDDYAELMDHAASGTDNTTILSPPQVYRPHVRFGGSVRHSAATSFGGWPPVFSNFAKEAAQ